MEDKQYKNLYITVLSFGFKYGIPSDADLVFDVRFLPNPYYIEELRPKNGNDKEVQDYVMQNEKTGQFLNKLTDMISFLILNYIAEGKTQLRYCDRMYRRQAQVSDDSQCAVCATLEQSEGDYGVKIEHRDIEKDAITKAR